MNRKTLAIIAFLTLQACVTRAQVRNAPADVGVSASYAAPWDRMSLAVPEALVQTGFAIKEDVPLEGRRRRLMATRGLSTGTSGVIVRVIVQDLGAECVTWVLVESKVSSRENEIADTALARSIHERIAALLNLPPPAMASPGTVQSSAPLSNEGAERTFQSPVPVCVDAAVKACRARDLRIQQENRAGGQSAKVVADGRGVTASILLDRDPAGRTKAAVYVRGHSSTVENREEAQKMLEKMREILKEAQ